MDSRGELAWKYFDEAVRDFRAYYDDLEQELRQDALDRAGEVEALEEELRKVGREIPDFESE